MDFTRDRTYERSSSQNLLGKTRSYSEDFKSNERPRVEFDKIQKDAGRGKLSWTAPRGPQDNLTSPFVSGEGEVNEFNNSRRKTSQYFNSGIEDGEPTRNYSLDFERNQLPPQSRDSLPVIKESGDRNGTTQGYFNNNNSSASVYGQQHDEYADDLSIANLTDPARESSYNHIGIEDNLLTNQILLNKRLTFEDKPVKKTELKPAKIYPQYPSSQVTSDIKQATQRNLPMKAAMKSRALPGSLKAEVENNHDIDDVYDFERETIQLGEDSREYNYALPTEQIKNKYLENYSHEYEHRGDSIRRDYIEESFETNSGMTMREDELGQIERPYLSNSQVQLNVPKTTGEGVKQQTSQSGSQMASPSESYHLKPTSSQGSVPVISMSRDTGHNLLERQNNKSSLPTDTRTTGRGSIIGKERPRYHADTGPAQTITSEAFRAFARSRLAGLDEQIDLLNASMTQRRIDRNYDPKQTVEEEDLLKRLNYFGLTYIVEPPQDDPLIEILDIRCVQTHASNMVTTAEIYSEHKRLYDRTQHSDLHTPAFALLFHRAARVVSLLEKEISTCPNNYRVALFRYLVEILQQYNQVGNQVLDYLPSDWESLSLDIQRYSLILLKERYFAEASNCLSELNRTQEAKLVSLLESENVIENHIVIDTELDQDDDLSVSSETAFNVFSDLVMHVPTVNHSAKEKNYYDPRLTTNRNQLSVKENYKSPFVPNRLVRTPERNRNEGRDHGSPRERGISPLGMSRRKDDEPILELLEPQRISYDVAEIEDLDDNSSRATTIGQNGLPSGDSKKVGVIFSRDTLYAKRDSEVRELQLKLGFNEHQREVMMAGGVGSTTLDNLDWKCRVSQYKSYQYCVNLHWVKDTFKLDYEKFLADSAMRARTLTLSTKELVILFKETGMSPIKETIQSSAWANKYPTIVSRVLSNVNWERGINTAEEWLYWELLWNKIRIEIVSLGIAKKNDNTLHDRLEKSTFRREINFDSPNDIENLDSLTTWIDKLVIVYRTSNQSKLGYSYLWHYVLRKLIQVNCPYVMVWIKFLKEQMHKAMTLMGLTHHDRQQLFGTTPIVEREEDNLVKDDFDWAIESLRTSHINNHIDYSMAVVLLRNQQSPRREQYKNIPQPPPEQNRKGQRTSHSVTTNHELKFDMFDGSKSKSLNQVEKNHKQENYLLANSVLILNLLKDRSPEAILKAAKFREFLLKNNLTICPCGLMKETQQCNEHCVIMVNNEFKVGSFIQFLKNKSQRLGRKYEEKEVLQHLKYVQRNAKWDESKLLAYHKSVMDKWSSTTLSVAAVTKVLSVLSVSGAYSHQLDEGEEEEDVSYSETDSSHY